MHDSARHFNDSGDGGSYSSLPLLDSIEPDSQPINSVVFIVINPVLRGGGVGIDRNPIPQLAHGFVQILAIGGARIYKTGKEQTLVNHCLPHYSCGCSRCRYNG